MLRALSELIMEQEGHKSSGCPLVCAFSSCGSADGGEILHGLGAGCKALADRIKWPQLLAWCSVIRFNQPYAACA